jgi:hypothetical protein
MRYIIIEKELGVFVGQFDIYAVYAKNEMFGLDRVISFESRKIATEIVEEFLNREGKEFSIQAIDTKGKYVKVIDIIKAGFGKYTHHMMDNIMMTSDSLH